MPISLLIFDLDGTLVNTLEDIAAAVNYTLARLGRDALSEETVRGFVGDGIEVLLKRALGGNTKQLPDAVRLYKEYHSRNLMVHSRLYPGVRETLEYFSALPLAVITNKASAFVGPVLEHAGIAGYFKRTIGADSGLPLKPAPDGLERIMAEFKAPKERTVIVGDGSTDIEAGKAAGIITCAATYGFRSEQELRNHGADYLIEAFSQLKTLFQPAENGTRKKASCK